MKYQLLPRWALLRLYCFEAVGQVLAIWTPERISGLVQTSLISATLIELKSFAATFILIFRSAGSEQALFELCLTHFSFLKIKQSSSSFVGHHCGVQVLFLLQSVCYSSKFAR